MRGYVRKEVMIDAELMEKFNREARRHHNHGGYYEPTLSRFVNDALSDFMDEWFKGYPEPTDD